MAKTGTKRPAPEDDDGNREPLVRKLGIKNLGNTCFMSATLQCLAHTKQLTDYFKGERKWSGKIVEAFAKFLQELQFNSTPIRPDYLKKAVGNIAERFNSPFQQDAQEFLTFLLDGLHENLNEGKEKGYVSMSIEGEDTMTDKDLAEHLWEKHKLRNDSKIIELFHGQMKSITTCSDCNTVKRTYEPISQLTLPIPIKELYSRAIVELGECLKLYTQPKRVENLMYCEHCQQTRDGYQEFKVGKLPPILIVYLKRFYLNQ